MENFPTLARDMVKRMQDSAKIAPMRAIAFQGSPGANSHRAACEAAPDLLPLPCPSFEDALDAVTQDLAGCAIIPIENSKNGRVADIHFLLPESGLAIVGEYFMPITHALMAKPHKDGTFGPFTAAYSHPQALGQSRAFLRQRGITPIAHGDTAGAAAYIAERADPSLAAIAPKMAADLYGLEIAEDAVEDAHDNTTRFVILAKAARAPQDLANDQIMTTLIFEVKNIPAALYKAMGGFATNGVNMTKLESYQKGASFSATMFYADIIGAPGNPAVDRALEELAFHCKEYRILGTYPLARTRG